MIKRWESHRIPLAEISLISLKIAVLCRYDGGADIIGYHSCDSSADPSTNDHTDYRPNYCPTKTRKISTTDPNDGDFDTYISKINHQSLQNYQFLQNYPQNRQKVLYTMHNFMYIYTYMLLQITSANLSCIS
jgi:hypothetical protein